MNLQLLGFEGITLNYFLSFLYIAALLLVLFGKHIRLAWIVVFFTGALVIPFALEIFIKNIIAFYAILIPPELWKGKPVKERGNGAGIILMALSLAFLMTSAGLFKLVDPVWKSGLGLYYSLNIPYFMPEHLWPLLDNKWLVVLLNHVTTFVEIISFPLVLFRKTRQAGIITLFLLGLFLTYPMGGIGLVGGPTLLSVSPLLLSITPNKNLGEINAFKNEIPNSKFFVYTTVFWYTMIGFYFHFASKVSPLVNELPKFGDFVVKNNHPPLYLPEIIAWRSTSLTYAFGKTRPSSNFESVWCLALFNYHHLFDRVIFKITFIDNEGNEYEPVHFFKENGAYHPEYPIIFNERFLLTCWKIMELRTAFPKNETIKTDNLLTFEKEMKALLKYCKNQLDSEIVPIEAILSVKSIHQPFQYLGNEKPWIKLPFRPVYKYNYKSKSHDFLFENIERFDFEQLQIEPFIKKMIVPKSN